MSGQQRTMKTPEQGECYHYEGDEWLEMFARDKGGIVELAVMTKEGEWEFGWATPEWNVPRRFYRDHEEVDWHDFPN